MCGTDRVALFTDIKDACRRKKETCRVTTYAQQIIGDVSSGVGEPAV
jgi:hypothetical protein